MSIRIVIADDHSIVRKGIKTEISEHSDLLVVGEAATTDEALHLVETARPDVLLLDIQMPGIKPVELIQKAKKQEERIKIIILSAFKEQAIVLGVMKAGADGYLLKDEDTFTIPQAIHKVMRGQSCISQSIAEVLINQVREPVNNASTAIFTDREKQVLAHIANGKSNKEIAKDTGMALRTVEAHISKIYEKLGTTSRTKAAFWAKENGLI